VKKIKKFKFSKETIIGIFLVLLLLVALFDIANWFYQTRISNKKMRELENLINIDDINPNGEIDYENDEEAAEYLSRGTKQYSVLIEPELLEKMASDKDTEAKYTGIIENATEQFEEIKGELGNDLANVKSIGFNLKEDGTMTLFADLEKASEQQRERIEKTKEEKKDSQKTEKADKATEAYKEKPKHVRVYADSISELVDKIKNIDWYKVKAEEAKEQGSRLDFSV